MRKLILVLALLLGFAPLSAVVATAHTNYVQVAVQGLQLFSTPQAAQRHCPSDTVVWLNIRSGIYHYAGQRWYGNTEYGAYVCEKEALAAGDRATRNGQ